jgi:hypothetical protein
MVGALSGPRIGSPGTGHWPWFLFEVVFSYNKLDGNLSWHIGVLGFTVGKLVTHDFNEDGTIAGPDKSKHYFFFKGINHQYKDIGEILCLQQ